MKLGVTIKIIYDPGIEPVGNKISLDYKKSNHMIDPID